MLSSARGACKLACETTKRPPVHHISSEDPLNVRSDLTDLDVSDGMAEGLIIITKAEMDSAPDVGGVDLPRLCGALHSRGNSRDLYSVDYGNDFAAGDRLVRPRDEGDLRGLTARANYYVYTYATSFIAGTA